MKAYTDLEQSKKLAEILPIESADMTYCAITEGMREKMIIKDWQVNIGLDNAIKENLFSCRNGYMLPCWSLAALLSVLPTYLFEFDRGIDLNVYPNLNGRGWHCSYMPNCIENMKTDKFKLITSGDTLVDACFEMILKLHELKLL